jgi:hypothetical protein
MNMLVGVLLCLSNQVSLAFDFRCETFLERPDEVRQLMLLSWLEGTRVENQYYRLNALPAQVEAALSEVEPDSYERHILTEGVGAAITHMNKTSAMVVHATRNREALFSKVDEYCARPEIRGATVFEIIPYAIIELMNAEADAPQE